MHVFIAVVVVGILALACPGVIRRIRERLKSEAKKGVQLAEVDVKKLDQDLKNKL